MKIWMSKFDNNLCKALTNYDFDSKCGELLNFFLASYKIFLTNYETNFDELLKKCYWRITRKKLSK